MCEVDDTAVLFALTGGCRTYCRRMRLKVLVLLLVLALGAACSGGSKHKAVVAPSVSPTPSAGVSPTVSPSPAVASDPLTGAAARHVGPVVAVKIDNAPLARPYQTGLDRAAIVYQELVEGGLTRLLAVYESDDGGSGEVGPIRSARESDVPLLRMFGGIPIGFSGAQPGVKAIFHSAQHSGWLLDASYDLVPGAYRLGARRPDARNFYTKPARLGQLRKGRGPIDIGLRFGPLGTGAQPISRAVVAYSPATSIRVIWTAAGWKIEQNGFTMPGVHPANVIIQRVTERGSRFIDIHHQTTPYTVTVGSGSATVLRNGKRVSGSWVRTGYGATHFRDARGQDIPLAPGRTWVLLLPTTGSVGFF